MQFEPLSEEYVDKLVASDEVAIKHFVHYFGSLIVIKLRSRQLSPPVIDEIRQETFTRVLSAIRKPGSIRDGRKLGAFVNSTCNHVLSEHYRSGTRFAELETEHMERLSEQLDAEQVMIERERDEQVRAVLERLPDRDRRILTALFLDEMEKDSVCAEFGVDRGYLRVLLHRAKISFRERFKN